MKKLILLVSIYIVVVCFSVKFVKVNHIPESQVNYLFAESSVDTSVIVNRPHYSTSQGDKGVEWVAYRLTAEMVQGDTLVFKRPSISPYENRKESQYTNTGYDRSHLAPAKTFSFDSLAYLSVFNMINIVPQTPKVNRRVWRYLEEYERCMALEYGCIYVVIRVHHAGLKVKDLLIPDFFERKIYTCDLREIGDYKIKNLQDD